MMFGDTCAGIVCDLGELLQFAVTISHDEEGRAEEWIGDARSDGMGLDTIWYWPRVGVEGE